MYSYFYSLLLISRSWVCQVCSHCSSWRAGGGDWGVGEGSTHQNSSFVLHPKVLSYRPIPGPLGPWLRPQPPGRSQSQNPSSPPGGQQLLGPRRRWEPTARYLGARACPAAFLPGQQLPACGPSPEDLCGHSSQASSWKGKEGCIILGKAYRLHLPRSTHFPCLPPPAPLHPSLPSSFTLSGGFSISCAFFSFSFLSGQDRVVSLGGKGQCVRGVQLHFKDTLLASYEFAFANVGKQGDSLAFFSPQTEIDVISLPVVPKEMFCSISSPFRLSPIYVPSWGTAIENHCHYHQHLKLAKSSSCGLMPTLTKVYFLDNTFLFGPTFLVFLLVCFFLFSFSLPPF